MTWAVTNVSLKSLVWLANCTIQVWQFFFMQDAWWVAVQKDTGLVKWNTYQEYCHRHLDWRFLGWCAESKAIGRWCQGASQSFGKQQAQNCGSGNFFSFNIRSYTIIPVLISMTCLTFTHNLTGFLQSGKSYWLLHCKTSPGYCFKMERQKTSDRHILSESLNLWSEVASYTLWIFPYTYKTHRCRMYYSVRSHDRCVPPTEPSFWDSMMYQNNNYMRTRLQNSVIPFTNSFFIPFAYLHWRWAIQLLVFKFMNCCF